MFYFIIPLLISTFGIRACANVLQQELTAVCEQALTAERSFACCDRGPWLRIATERCDLLPRDLNSSSALNAEVKADRTACRMIFNEAKV